MEIDKLLSKIKLTKLNVLVEEYPYSYVLSGEKNKPKNTAKVLAVSPNVDDIKVGDNIFYSIYAGVYVHIFGKKYVLLSKNEIFGHVGEEYNEDEFEVGETTDLVKYAEDLQSQYNLTGNDLNIKL